MRTLLNTIAVEPNRWTKERRPAHDLVRELLPPVAAHGFRHLELWQFHYSRMSLEEAQAAREAAAKLGLDFPVVGVYPQFHLEGAAAEAARAEAFGVVERAALLGARWVKFFFGKIKGSEITPRQLELTTQRVGAWVAHGRAKGLGFCAELHGWTLFDPYEYGRAYLAAHPELDLRVCYQPQDKQDVAKCLGMVRELGARIVHAHFSGSNAAGRCLLEDADFDWPAVVRALQEANRDFLPAVEFVPRSFPPKGATFDLDGALADAAADARYLDRLLERAV